MEAILGIDPGAVSGWALLSVESSPAPIIKGVFNFKKPTKGQPGSPSALVRSIREEAAVRSVEIVCAAIEDQYLGENPDSMKKLARNAGRWEEACKAIWVSVQFVAPSSWQSKELGLHRARSATLRKAANGKAFGIWGMEAPEHVIDATLIARYVAVTMYHKIQQCKAL